jgi:hypothetical protein
MVDLRDGVAAGTVAGGVSGGTDAGTGRTMMNDVEKKRYVKLTHMGVSSVQPLDPAIEELREAFKCAMTTDVLEVQFVEMTEAEYMALPEFPGY